MDSAFDGYALLSRVSELEQQVQHLQNIINDLKKEKAAIFYKWTKEDFIDLLKICVSDIDETYNITNEFVDRYWLIWTDYFDKRWSSAETNELMLYMMREMLEEYP